MTGLLVLAGFAVAPALAGEAAIWLSGGRERLGTAVGSVVAAATVAGVGLVLTFCGMSDEPSSTCDDKIGAAPTVIAVGLTAVGLHAAIALARPSRARRWMVWATPLAMMIAVAAVARSLPAG